MEFSKQFNPPEQAVLKTLLYSDLFDFPLTKNELWKFLMSPRAVDKQLFEQALIDLVQVTPQRKKIHHADGLVFTRKQTESDEFSGITVEDGLYCLAGREEIIRKRKNNFLEVKQKLSIAEKAAQILSFIPTIKCIGITGGLALNNASQADDIDFFIITKKNTLFLTRFWILLVLEAMGLRRKRNDKNPANKICVNLLLDETQLAWAEKDQNMYVAHEIFQLKPIFERHNTYEKFIENNYWIKKYFPNFKKSQIQMKKNGKNNYWILHLVGFPLFLLPIEIIMRNLQKSYMKGHKTSEIVSNSLLALHPRDYRTQTIEKLRLKYQKLGLLTKF